MSGKDAAQATQKPTVATERSECHCRHTPSETVVESVSENVENPTSSTSSEFFF